MDKIKLYLQWWKEYTLPESIERAYDLEEILQSRLIPVLVGPRRCGKSTLLMQLIRRMQVSRDQLIYVNFEDDRLLPLDGSELTSIINAHRQLSGLTHDSRLYLFLDEVQNLPGWEKTVRRLYETEPGIRLFITGSNAAMFASNIASSLRGRALTFPVRPLRLGEFLVFSNQETLATHSESLQYSGLRNPVLHFFDFYLKYGGFPEVVLAESPELKQRILREYLHTIFFADLIDRYEIRQVRLMDTFLKILARQMSALVSAGKLTNTLNSIGFKTTKNTVLTYLGYIEEAMFGHTVPIYSYSVKDQFQYPRKFYLTDNGLYAAATFIRERDYGRLLENLVFSELQRLNEPVYYWKDRQDFEVDFVLPHLFDHAHRSALIQVCFAMEDERIRNREIRALVRAASELNVRKASIITRDTWDHLREGELDIDIIPFIDWCRDNKNPES